MVTQSGKDTVWNMKIILGRLLRFRIGRSGITILSGSWLRFHFDTRLGVWVSLELFDLTITN